MAHYAADCWDCEIHTSYGWVECVGIADRSAYDLKVHSAASKVDLVAQETYAEPRVELKTVLKINKKKFGPHFRKDNKKVEGALLEFSEAQLKIVAADLAANGTHKFKLCTGEEFEVNEGHEEDEVEGGMPAGKTVLFPPGPLGLKVASNPAWGEMGTGDIRSLFATTVDGFNLVPGGLLRYRCMY